jgi:peptidyl-prolyl cis-trans isomerase SurA
MSTAPSSRSATPAKTATEPAATGRVSAAWRAGTAVCAVLFAAALGTRPARAAVVEEIVAKINNRIITSSEFDERQKALFAQVNQDHPGPGMSQELQDAQDVLLANIITEALLLERATAIFDMDRIRNSLIEDFKKQQNIKDDTELEKALTEQQMTRKELEDHLIRITVPNEIINYDVKRKISVSETEMKDYYAAHKPRWETQETVSFREIVLLYEDPTRDEEMERAKRVASEARGTADFASLVMQYSEAGTREVQGLIGPVALHDLQAALANAITALKPGEISDPVDTGHSFHILRLETRTAASMKTFAEVHDEIHDAVRDEKFKPRFDSYLKRLWKENHIEVSPKYESWLVVTPLKPKTTG